MSLFGLDFTAEHPRVHDRDDLTRYMEGAGYILSHALVQVIVDEAAALNINASNAPRAEDMMVGMLLRRGAQHHGLVLQNGEPSLFAQPVETSAPRAPSAITFIACHSSRKGSSGRPGLLLSHCPFCHPFCFVAAPEFTELSPYTQAAQSESQAAHTPARMRAGTLRGRAQDMVRRRHEGLPLHVESERERSHWDEQEGQGRARVALARCL